MPGDQEEELRKKNAQEAFDAIHDIALSLSLEDNLSQKVRDGLGLVVSLARYQHDVRSPQEIAAFKSRG